MRELIFVEQLVSDSILNSKKNRLSICQMGSLETMMGPFDVARSNYKSQTIMTGTVLGHSVDQWSKKRSNSSYARG